MQQMMNIIRIEEGGVSNPFIVIERMSQFAEPTVPEGCKLIREQRGGEAFLLLCRPIPDANFEDVPSDEETKSHKTPRKTGHSDKSE